jgi:hypothetical protein
MKLFSTTRPLKLKLEEATKKLEQLEEEVKADKVEIDRMKQVGFTFFSVVDSFWGNRTFFLNR